MLTPPKYGWTHFGLEGFECTYRLSDVFDNIAFRWVDQAVHGLETLSPFCVKGYMEPDRMICVVSYWNCRVFVEREEKEGSEKIRENSFGESHTSMIEFCRRLAQEIRANLDEWTSFGDSFNEYGTFEENRQLLVRKLEKLEALIADREGYFTPNESYFYLD